MKNVLIVSAAMMMLASAAMAAPLKCVAVQVNEGGPVPSITALKAVLPRGGCIRDALGWHQVEKVKGQYTAIPAPMFQSYTNAQGAEMANLVTLAFGDKIYGGNNQTFPTTDEQITAFKNYAVWAVTAAHIPNLYGVSIWNEMNGSFSGGIDKASDRMAAYAKLVNIVGPAIRAANPDVKIIIGATVGSNIGGWYTHLFADYKMWGKNDPNVYLDVHPYIGQGITTANPVPSQLTAWNNSMKQIRKDGITNALFATEFGDGVAAAAETGEPGLNYVDWAQTNIFSKENFAGVAWFTMVPEGKFTNGTLLDNTGQLTKLGVEYQAWKP